MEVKSSLGSFLAIDTSTTAVANFVDLELYDAIEKSVNAVTEQIYKMREPGQKQFLVNLAQAFSGLVMKYDATNEAHTMITDALENVGDTDSGVSLDILNGRKFHIYLAKRDETISGICTIVPQTDRDSTQEISTLTIDLQIEDSTLVRTSGKPTP